MATYLILDSEAIDSIAHATRRSASAKRAQSVLTSAHRFGALVRVPAAVLVEVYRCRREDSAIDRVLNNVAQVVPTGRSIARIAGKLLAENKLDSSHAVDAVVVATAIRLGGGLIATHDSADLKHLAQRHPNVKILSI